MGTFRTYTVKVEGCHITFRNLTIENQAPRKGQAVALHTEGDCLRFVNCRFLGNQDTIYTGMANTRLYFEDCYIEGTTDFIFGPSTAWFEGCTIHSKINSYITAASTPKDVKYGYVFNNCTLTAAEGVDKVFLGRPWRAYAYTLFMNCDLGKHIVPEGWQNWKDYHDPAQEGTVRYQEYNNRGAGANPQQRVAWSKQLSKKEIKEITIENVLNGWK
jgi:pectin methylesterase-like acyl-CoA thioesterase